MWKDLINYDTATLGKELATKAQWERDNGVEIFPPQKDIFRAMKLTQPENLKVCLIGQDPYHTPGAANGLAFSVNPDAPIPPSLRNIFTELHNDIGCEIPHNGDLSKWAEQGVLLLNTTLTVEAHKPASHKSWGWDIFTKRIFNICLNLDHPVVFILWGRHAQGLAAGVDWTSLHNKKVIVSVHPSPFSASNGFFGSCPFSRANGYLISMGVPPVDWNLC